MLQLHFGISTSIDEVAVQVQTKDPATLEEGANRKDDDEKRQKTERKQLARLRRRHLRED